MYSYFCASVRFARIRICEFQHDLWMLTIVVDHIISSCAADTEDQSPVAKVHNAASDRSVHFFLLVDDSPLEAAGPVWLELQWTNSVLRERLLQHDVFASFHQVLCHQLSHIKVQDRVTDYTLKFSSSSHCFRQSPMTSGSNSVLLTIV
uniref:Uncharacterized protein n=1 Tax=Rhodosorus marinus TaxID=101924 RepID=A0A7S0G7M1_9RHOD|mmetsp:Transcript_6195/g.8747  ORF Transcript_6195/g.8747 Transcript_6195/m.8747 type:complete len:149 (+) Transcript_6195:302-748(+)